LEISGKHWPEKHMTFVTNKQMRIAVWCNFSLCSFSGKVWGIWSTWFSHPHLWKFYSQITTLAVRTIDTGNESLKLGWRICQKKTKSPQKNINCPTSADPCPTLPSSLPSTLHPPPNSPLWLDTDRCTRMKWTAVLPLIRKWSRKKSFFWRSGSSKSQGIVFRVRQGKLVFCGKFREIEYSTALKEKFAVTGPVISVAFCA